MVSSRGPGSPGRCSWSTCLLPSAGRHWDRTSFGCPWCPRGGLSGYWWTPPAAFGPPSGSLRSLPCGLRALFGPLRRALAPLGSLRGGLRAPLGCTFVPFVRPPGSFLWPPGPVRRVAGAGGLPLRQWDSETVFRVGLVDTSQYTKLQCS